MGGDFAQLHAGTRCVDLDLDRGMSGGAEPQDQAVSSDDQIEPQVSNVVG